MSVLTEILLFVYGSGFLGGLLCGLPAGLLVAVAWDLVQGRKRQAKAERFARELDQWVKEIETEAPQEPRVIGSEE